MADTNGRLPPHAIHFQKALFMNNICLYLEPYTIYLASKLTTVEKYSNIQHIWSPEGSYMGVCPKKYTFLEMARQKAVVLASICKDRNIKISPVRRLTVDF